MSPTPDVDPGAVAAIDCGTNSTRLLVIDSAGRELVRHMRITRLGAGVDATGELAPDAIDRTLAVLEDYARECATLDVRRLRATATSAARDSRNHDAFFGPAASLLGGEPELISGEEEAALSFAGAIAGGGHGRGPFLVCDIGGGSTEFVFGTAAPEALVSVDVGCVRVTERWLEGDPPSPASLTRAAAGVDAALDAVGATIPVAGAAELVGLAGTVTSLAALVAGLRVYDPSVTHGMRMSRADVEVAHASLAGDDLDTRRGRLIEAERADVIVGGTTILTCIMRRFGFETIVVSEHDILDGLAASVRAGAGHRFGRAR